jgi:hypothetical protein
MRDEAHLNNTGDTCNSQSVAKNRVDHRREHQGLSVPAERPSGNDDARILCKLH